MASYKTERIRNKTERQLKGFDETPYSILSDRTSPFVLGVDICSVLKQYCYNLRTIVARCQMQRGGLTAV